MRTLAAVAVVCWMFFAIGAHWGAGREREQARLPGGQAAVTGASAVIASTMPRLPLRCENGDPPREWTQQEIEARYHTAAQWLRTAEDAGVWSDRGRRAAMLAVGQLLEVIACVP